MSPLDLLCLAVAVTAGAGATQAILDRKRRRRLRDLAGRWSMHYAERDRFRLAPRIAHLLPVPGAADVVVRDLIYGMEGPDYRYFFTVEYSLYTVGPRSRVRAVATFAEPRDVRAEGGAGDVALTLAPPAMPELEQYDRLRADTRAPDVAAPTVADQG